MTVRTFPLLIILRYSAVKVKLSNARRKFGLLMDAGSSLSDSNKLLRIFNEFQ